MIAGDIDAAEEAPEHYARLYRSAEETIIETAPGRWRSYYENIADALARPRCAGRHRRERAADHGRH